VPYKGVISNQNQGGSGGGSSGGGGGGSGGGSAEIVQSNVYVPSDDPSEV
jgi:hypothetical protein